LYRIPIFEGHDSVTPALWRGLVFMHDNGSSFREAVIGYVCDTRHPSYRSVLENPRRHRTCRKPRPDCRMSYR
jgi:hypothetical protein